MKFWFFMLIMTLLIPLIMIIFGALFLRKAPSNINYVFGYRTGMSMKNKDTWEFAHRYCGKLWLILGLIMLPLTVIAMLQIINADKDVIGSVGSVISFIQLIPLIFSIIPTEIALKKNFDKDGNFKTKQ